MRLLAALFNGIGARMHRSHVAAQSTVDGGGLRRFYLYREVDETGVSGTGRVADGVEFPDGKAALRWRGTASSTVLWDSIEDAITVHGHAGKTRLVFID